MSSQSADPLRGLAALATEINAEHEAGEASRLKGLEHYRRAGEALLKAKEKCGHGGWLPWLKKNVRCSQRRAYHYLEFAKVAVTANLEEQEAAWRRISGNAPSSDEDDAGDCDGVDEDDDGQDGAPPPSPKRLNLMVEIVAIHKWLATRRDKWPAEVRDVFIDCLRKIIVAMENEAQWCSGAGATDSSTLQANYRK